MKEPFYSIHNARMRGEKRKTEVLIKLLNALAEYIPILAVMEIFHNDPWMISSWLFSANTRLNNKVPFDLLTKEDGKDYLKVVRAAKQYGEHGAV